METDRFNSKENVEWNSEAESQGRLARMDGFPLSVNPYKNPYDKYHENWFFKSWAAGWVDADMDPAAPKNTIIS